MPTFGGLHTKTGTDREFSYWATYEIIGSSVVYSSIITEGLRLHDQPQGEFRFDPAGVPASKLVRLAVTRYIDRTDFGVGQAPTSDPIAWNGPVPLATSARSCPS